LNGLLIMQELVGRITALDPVASESLRVIAYFDALIEGHATAEALLRAASVLIGCAVGFVAGDMVMRLDDRGIRIPVPAELALDAWPNHSVSDDWHTWIERSGEPHANDEMVLERLAIGLGICLERTHPIAIVRRNLEILIDAGETAENRANAATRLRLGPGVLQIVATPADVTVDSKAKSVVVATPSGRVRAILTAPDGGVPLPNRCGIGMPVDSTNASRSWNTALIALRMTSPAEPLVDAAGLGSVLLLAEAADASPVQQPDVIVIEDVVAGDPRNLDQMELILRSDSIRAAAVAAKVHHSTMQGRVTELSDRLGFDVRSPDGRVRLALAIRLYRLATTRFHDSRPL
jgi:hypothetical protein